MKNICNIERSFYIMASLSLKNVCKVYPNGFEAVKNFNLEIDDQEFIIFVGLQVVVSLQLFV